MTKLHPIAICILEMPGWQFRGWLAIVITLLLVNLPVPVAGLIPWLPALTCLMMSEAAAHVIVEGCRSRRRIEADHRV